MTAKNPFMNLHNFIRVVELGSIRAVAQATGVEPSNISRSVTALENRIGVQLLDRSQAKSRPTEAGQIYYHKMRPLLNQITGIEAEVRGDQDVPHGVLRVNASIDFGQQHVAGWLLDFRDLHPKVDVELTLSARRVDIVAQGLDLAIRIGAQDASSLMTRKLADNHRVIVAAPAYLDRYGTPRVPKDLEHHQYIHFLPGNRTQPLRLTGPDGKAHDVMRHGGITIDAIMAIVDAVKRGHGIHTGPRWAFQDALEQGDVCEILAEYRADPMPIYATWPQATFLPAKTRAFIDYAVARAKQVRGL